MINEACFFSPRYNEHNAKSFYCKKGDKFQYFSGKCYVRLLINRSPLVLHDRTRNIFSILLMQM